MIRAPDTADAAPAGGRWPPRATLQGSVPAAAGPTLKQTLGEVVADAGGLLRAEASLAKLETQSNLSLLARAGGRVGLGAALIFLALVFATVTMVVALAAAIGLVWSLLAVTGLCLLVGLLMLGSARARLKAVRLLPEEALGRMAADLDRLSGRTAAIRGLPTAGREGEMADG